MQVDIADAGAGSRTLTITIPADQVRAHLADAYTNAAQHVQLPGFRAGKVPRKVIEKKYGDAIRSEAKESLINHAYQHALREHELNVVGRPRIEGIDDTPLSESDSVEFQIHVAIRPELEIGTVTGIAIDRMPTDVTDDDMEGALAQLADQKKTLETVDEPVADGDFVRADLTFRNAAGETVQEKQGVQLNNKIPIAGTDHEEFAARLLGNEKGSEVELEMTFPDNFDAEDMRGEKGSVTIKIHDVLRIQPPPIDDELAKGFDLESLDALKEELQKRIGEEKSRSETARQEEAILDIIANDHPFEVPKTLVDEQTEVGLQNYARQLEQNGVSKEEIEQRVEQAQDEAAVDSRRRIKMFFLLEAIAKQEKIFVTEGDMDVELRKVAAQHRVTPEEAREQYEKQDALEELRLGVMERKVRDYLRENAEITDRTGE